MFSPNMQFVPNYLGLAGMFLPQSQGGYANLGGQPAQPSGMPPLQNAQMFSDPFSTARSGTQSGTLQPYINRMTQNASNALYGGLLGYQPQPMISGNAGGTPIQTAIPQGFSIPSALAGMMGQGLSFGNRSWMQGANNG